MPTSEVWIVPDWPAPANVHALVTTRAGGVSHPPYDRFNLGEHVGDDPAAVAANRRLLRQQLHGAGEPVWLEQVHGTRVVDAAGCLAAEALPRADASFSRASGVCCAVMTADCLPVLFCDENGSVVAAAHAGWRGLLAGVLEQTMAAMAVPSASLFAYLGPAIGPQAFIVGDEVRSAFVADDAVAASSFAAQPDGKWLADLYALARLRLNAAGVDRIYGGTLCTVSDSERFFSYRRDGRTGRMASLIWRVADNASAQ